jgi:hypothetical protein
MWRDVGGESSRPAPLVLADHEQRVTGTLGQRLRTVLGDDLVQAKQRRPLRLKPGDDPMLRDHRRVGPGRQLDAVVDIEDPYGKGLRQARTSPARLGIDAGERQVAPTITTPPPSATKARTTSAL